MPIEKLTILDIDDDEGDIILLRRYLQKIAGWEVNLQAFHDLASAQPAIVKGEMDVIFIDYVLGATSGLAVFRAIRDLGCQRPVIMLTGQGSEMVAVEAMKAGAADYLVKGHLTPDGLRRSIANALEKTVLKDKISAQHKDLIDAERQRVMLESVGATCHHFSQPLMVMLDDLRSMAECPDAKEPERTRRLNDCLEAARLMTDLLRKFRHLRQYRTKPYVDDTSILDIGPDAPSDAPAVEKCQTPSPPAKP